MKKNILIVALIALSMLGARYSSDYLDHIIEEHAHSASQVYPTLAVGETAVAGAQWVLGVFEELIPINTIGEDFDIHYISVEDIDTNAVYELVLYAVETEIGRARFTKNAVQDGTMNVPIQTKIQLANTQIQIKIACGDAAGACEADFSAFYHVYE